LSYPTLFDLLARGDQSMRHPVPGTQFPEIRAVRGPEDALEALRLGILGLLEQREDPAAVVVDHHDGQVRALLARPEQQAVDVVQERQVADQRISLPTVRAV